MKQIKNYKFFFQFLSPNRKFLALVLYPQLKYLEKIYKIYLGSAKENKKRPCIFWKDLQDSGEFFKVVFLTHSKPSSALINLNFCKEKEKRCGKGFYFYHNSFVFSTPDRKFLCIKLKDTALISEFVNCGPCENLEILENFNFVEF